MNRHHPYGYDSGVRRGGSPTTGPGPDRYPRFQERGGPGPRGRGRGRGGYAGYENNVNYSGYDQGPPQPDMGSYGYDSTQDYYQSYGGSSSAYQAYTPPPPSSASYGGNYVKVEEAAPANLGFDDEFGRPRRKPPRDEKVQNAIIEERIQRERPCRTLFIRNIKYETPSAYVRRMFEEHGDIKTFFDLISTRGMVFVTYYDIRSAERARERLQGSEISGRPIDVHYSLPRDDNNKGGEKNQQLQGCLQVTLRSSASGQPIDDNEVRRKFQQFGDVKEIIPVGDRPDSRYVEFYDTRACDEAFDRLRHQGLQDGVMDIVFAWDPRESSGAGGRESFDDHRGGARGGRGGRGAPRGRGRGRDYDDDRDRRGGDYSRDKGRPLYDDEYGRSRGPPPGRPPVYNDRYDGGRSSYSGGGAYGNPPPSNYPPPPPPPAQPPSAPAIMQQPPLQDDRLVQAQKVQQLLAALKQPAATPPPSAPTSYPSYPPSSSSSYPPSAQYGVPPTSVAPSAPATASASAALPPNLMALLQNVQQQQGGAASNDSAPNYQQQLMSFLQAAQR